MKDVLVVYTSKTGNTKKVAQSLYEAAEERCELASVEDAVVKDEHKLICVGYWVDRGGPTANIQDFLATLHNKNVILFQTLGADPKSDHAVVSLTNAAKFLNSDCRVVGNLSLQGAIDPNLIASMRKLPEGTPHAPTPEAEARWAKASTHPDAEDLATAKKFMVNTLVFVDKYYKID